VFGSGPLAGAAAYQDSTTGSLASVPSQTSGSSRFFFGHIASLFPWYTGIALLNTTNYAANVEISAIDSRGNLIGSLASFSLPGGSRSTKLLSEFVPSVTQRLSDGGFVYIRTSNSVPVLSFELFGHAVFPILANVQGFPLSSTSSYLSPISTDPISGITVAGLTFTDGTETKTQFKPNDTIQYVATLGISSDSSGPAQLTFTVIDPRGQTMLTSVSSVVVPVFDDIT